MSHTQFIHILFRALEFPMECFYLALDEREAMARSWGSGRTRAFWWSLI